MSTIKARDIKVVFFDLGKVILKFDHENIIERLLSETPAAARRPDEMFRVLFDHDDGLCNLYDKGAISSRDFHGEIEDRFATGLSFEDFAPLWDDIFTEDEAVSRLIRRVREKRPVFLLSNVNELHWEFAVRAFPVLSELDGLVLSYKIGERKPDPGIFEAALLMSGAGPGEAVFIDDLDTNVLAASSHGIHGVVFKGAEPLEDELLAIGLI